MSPIRALLLLVLGLAAATAAAGDQVMEIVPLKHRLVADVLPTLRQLVADGGTVTGMNEQVIVRSTPENVAELKAVLAALDTPVRQLRISVRQDVTASNQFREDALSARVRTGDPESGIVRGGVGRPAGGPGARIGIGGNDYQVEYQNFSTRGREDRENAHFVTTLEGSPAFINTGQVVPLANSSVYWTPYGATYFDNIQYRNVGAGFYVTPRLVGENGVNLEISPYADRLDGRGGGAIDSRGLSTVASGQLGQWIPLGGATRSINDAQSGILYRTRELGDDNYDVWVKVEVVP